MMKITDVDVHIVKRDNSKMRAYVTVTIDGLFVVHDIRILEGSNGLFLAMPSKQIAPGEHRDIAHPISADARKIFEDAIYPVYEEALAKADTEEETDDEE